LENRTNYVVHTDVEPSCINYACRKAPDTDWSKESSDVFKKEEFLSESGPDQETIINSKIRLNLNKTCEEVKGKGLKSPKST
jgi:hypothetical protein